MEGEGEGNKKGFGVRMRVDEKGCSCRKRVLMVWLM